MWELDDKESWALKNPCFWTAVFEKTLESPLGCKETKQVNPKGNQSWIFIVRTNVEAETPTLWPPDVKNWLIGKDPDAGKDWRQEMAMTEDEMVGWHRWLDRQEFEQALGVGDRQGGLACCHPWGRKESDTTEQLNWTLFKVFYFLLFWCGPFFKSLLYVLQYYFPSMLWFLGYEACGILAPWPRIEPALRALEGKVSTSGPPRKSQ